MVNNKGGKETILDAARRIIARNGVNNASVQSIADEAGLSKGAVYYHYQGKDYILYDLVDQFLRAAIAPVKKSLYESGDNEELTSGLLSGISQRLEDIEHNRLQFYLTHEALVSNGEMHTQFSKKYNGWIDTGEAIMERLYNIPPSELNRALAATVIAAIDGQVIQSLLNTGVSTDKLIQLWKILIDVGIPHLLNYMAEMENQDNRQITD